MNEEQLKILRLVLVFVVVILAGLVVWKTGLLEPNLSGSPLVVSEPEFDFGEISMARGNVVKTISLKNDGSEPLKITDISTSCMCTIATIDGIPFGMHKNPAATFTLPANGSKEMTITFDPNAHGPDAVGPISRVVFIRTNSEKTPLAQVKFSGVVVK